MSLETTNKKRNKAGPSVFFVARCSCFTSTPKNRGYDTYFKANRGITVFVSIPQGTCRGVRGYFHHNYVNIKADEPNQPDADDWGLHGSQVTVVVPSGMQNLLLKGIFAGRRFSGGKLDQSRTKPSILEKKANFLDFNLEDVENNCINFLSIPLIFDSNFLRENNENQQKPKKASKVLSGNFKHLVSCRSAFGNIHLWYY